MQEEIWKDIPNYEGLYQVSTFGRIRNTKTKKIKKQRNTYKKYLQVDLFNKNQKTYRVHRLVAETFIPNLNNLPQVNHKDGNKQNNRVDNLEWITNYDNIQHAVKNGFFKRNKGSSRKTEELG